MAALKVAIVGSGPVGTTLGKALLRKSPAIVVKYGSRTPASQKMQDVLADQPSASADTIENVTSWADAVILATPSFASDEAIQGVAASLGPGIKGKVLIDTVNPLSPYPGLEIRWKEVTSHGEVLAAALPDTHVFKAFNTIGVDLMGEADGSKLGSGQLTMLFAGPKEAEATAIQVIAGVGFLPVYVGGIRFARNLEALAELYIHTKVLGQGDPATWKNGLHFQALGHP